MTEEKTYRFKFLTYDLWGNADDGFDVNDYYPQFTFELKESDLATDETLLAALFRENVIDGVPDMDKLEITDGGELGHGLTIYLNYDGRPELELREVRD